MNGKIITQFFIVFCIFLIINPVVGVSDCGPSKGPIINVYIVTPIISDSQSTTNPDFSNTGDNYSEPTNLVIKGNEDLLEGRYQEAIESFDKALVQDKNQPDAWNGIMSAYLSLNKYDDVISIFHDAKDIIPNNSGIWVNKGRAEYYSGNITEAFQSADMALGLENQNIDALILKANALVDLGYYEDALELCDQILTIDPNNQEVWYVKGVTQYFNKEYAKATDSLEKDLKLNPDRICSYFYLSLSKKEISGADSALQVLEEMADHFPPENTGAHAELTGLLSRLIKDSPDIDLEKTVPLWEKIFQANSTSEQDYYNEFREGRWSLITSALEKYIHGDIGSLDSITSIVDPLLSISGNLSDKQRDDIILMHSEFINNIYASKRDLETIEAVDRVLNLDPENKSGYNDFVLYRKVFCQVNLGRDEDALATIEEALQINPDDDSNWEYKGDILKRLGRDDDAIEAFDTAKTLKNLRLKPENDAFESNNDADETENENNANNSILNYSKLLENATKEEDWDNVIAIAREAEDNFHQVDIEIYKQLGETLQKLGRTDEALNAFDKVIESTDDPLLKSIYYEEKGKLLFQLGRYEEAVAEYEKGAEYKMKDSIYWNTQISDSTELDEYKEINPDNVAEAGYPLYLAGKYESAYEAFNKSINSGITDGSGSLISSWIGLALTLEKLDRNTEAKETRNMATDLTVSDSFRNLVNELDEENENIRILDAFSYAIKIDPMNENIWLEKGDYQINNKKYDDAILSYEKALTIAEQKDNDHRDFFNQENWDYTDYEWILDEFKTSIQEKIDETMKLKSS